MSTDRVAPDGAPSPHTSVGFLPLGAPRLIVGALQNAPHRRWEALGLVQFSRSTEATGGGLPHSVSEN
jgi:hypothetical protein